MPIFCCLLLFFSFFILLFYYYFLFCCRLYWKGHLRRMRQEHWGKKPADPVHELVSPRYTSGILHRLVSVMSYCIVWVSPEVQSNHVSVIFVRGPAVLCVQETMLLPILGLSQSSRVCANYCKMVNFSDVKTLASLAINSFSLKLQVTKLVDCSTVLVLTSRFVQWKSTVAKIKHHLSVDNRDMLKLLVAGNTRYTVGSSIPVSEISLKALCCSLHEPCTTMQSLKLAILYRTAALAHSISDS